MTAELTTLRQLVRSTLKRFKEPDPHVLARKLARELPPELREDLIYWALKELLMEEGRIERNVRAVRQGRSRWSVSSRVCIAGDWKMLDDCGFEDLITYAEEREAEADSIRAVAQETRSLAQALRSAGCTTVGELRRVQDRGGVDIREGDVRRAA